MIHHILGVIAPEVLVIQVVGMLPHIHHHQGGLMIISITRDT